MAAPRHILVVEDEEHLAVGIKYNLQAEGYRVTVIGDGRNVIQQFDQPDSEIDLVILDLMLPGMSGYAVCDALRSAGRDVPILILSARTLTEDRTRGFDVGANQYLTKPFELEELLSRVKNLLTFNVVQQHPDEAPADVLGTFDFGDAHVNFDTHQVTVGGKVERLTSLLLKLPR